jgi:hypothetical protein
VNNENFDVSCSPGFQARVVDTPAVWCAASCVYYTSIITKLVIIEVRNTLPVNPLL